MATCLPSGPKAAYFLLYNVFSAVGGPWPVLPGSLGGPSLAERSLADTSCRLGQAGKAGKPGRPRSAVIQLIISGRTRV